MVSFSTKPVNITEGLLWEKMCLDAMSRKNDLLFISWRLVKASTFDGDMLLVFLH
jgi:hypothetical protein